MTITCTEKQAQIIRDACELYGRVQIGQFNDLATLLAFDPDSRSDDFRVCCMNRDMISQMLDGAYRTMYTLGRKTPDNADIALDLWAKLDNRRRKDNFVIGSEPMIKVEP